MFKLSSPEHNFIHKFCKMLKMTRSGYIFDLADAADALNSLIIESQMLEHLAEKYEVNINFRVRLYEEKEKNPLDEIRHTFCSHFMQKKEVFEDRVLSLKDLKDFKLHEIHDQLPLISIRDIIKYIRNNHIQHWRMKAKGTHKEVASYIKEIDPDLDAIIAIVSCVTSSLMELCWRCAVESKQTDLLWAHSTGSTRFIELESEEFHSLKKPTSIDFSKGIFWAGTLSFEKYDQMYSECIIFSHLVSDHPNLLLNLIYQKDTDTISLQLKYESKLYQTRIALTDFKMWRVVGFSLFPFKRGFVFSLFVDDQIANGKIKNCDIRFGKWDFKLGAGYDKERGIKVVLSDDVCLWTSDEAKVGVFIKHLNFMASTLPDDFPTKFKKLAVH